VISLTNTTFPARLERREKWLVYFYSSRCMYCRTTLAHFREASMLLEYPKVSASRSATTDPSTNVKYGTVDCSKFRQLCTELKVTLFPHVAYYDRLYDKSVNMYVFPDRPLKCTQVAPPPFHVHMPTLVFATVTITRQLMLYNR
jgi:hypothetical protein